MHIHGLEDLQLRPDPRRRSHFVRGLLIGAGLVTLLGIAYLFLRYYALKTKPEWWVLPKLAISALAASAVEEFLFRGAILGLLLRKLRPIAAIFWTTLIFAFLHFLKPDYNFSVQTVHWYSAFILIPHAFNQFTDPRALIGFFTTLFALGWLLGYARVRTGALWMSIGLHAGVIFIKMSFSKIAGMAVKKYSLLPWVGPEFSTGLIPVMMLLLGLLIVWRQLEYEELLPTPRRRG
jgi:membrane protease YdiL (CAAX protease family)